MVMMNHRADYFVFLVPVRLTRRAAITRQRLVDLRFVSGVERRRVFDFALPVRVQNVVTGLLLLIHACFRVLVNRIR